MKQNVTLLCGKYVLPGTATEPGWLSDAAVAVIGDKIEAVGPQKQLKEKYNIVQVYGGDEYIVIPGMVNGHHHGRGLSSFQMGSIDSSLEDWIYEIWTEPGTDLYLNTLYGALRLIESGITTVIHSHYHSPVEPENFLETAEVYMNAYDKAGLRVRLALGIKDQNLLVYGEEEAFIDSLPKEIRDDARWLANADIEPDRYFECFDKLYERCVKHPRLKIWLGPEGIQWCSDALLKRVAKTAEEYDVGIHMHGVESPLQWEYGRRCLNGDSILHLDEIGFLSRRVSIAHGVWTSNNAMHALEKTGAAIVTNPSSNLRLHNGIAPLSYMKQANVNLAMGLDGMGINDDSDYFQEGRICAALNRVHDAPPFTYADVFRIMTSGGAYAAGLEGQAGCLCPGAYADVVLLNWDEMNYPYVHEKQNPVDLTVAHGAARFVDTVMIGGEIVYYKKEFVKHNIKKIAQELAASVAYPEKGSPSSRFIELASKLRPYANEYYKKWMRGNTEPFYSFNSKK